MSVPEFEVSCNIVPSLFQELVSFDLATTAFGDFYFEGSVVNSIPGSAFSADGSGGFTLSGLSFLPEADAAGDIVVTHTMNTIRSDTLTSYTNGFDQEIRVCAIADIPEAASVGSCFTTNEDEVAAIPFITSLNDNDRSERFSRWQTALLSPVEDFKSLNGVTPNRANVRIPTRCGIDRCDNLDYPILAAEDFSGILELSVQVSLRAVDSTEVNDFVVFPGNGRRVEWCLLRGATARVF